MTIFQKLSWLVQMGVHHLCDEKTHPLVQKASSGSPNSLAELDKKCLTSKSSLSATATHPLSGIGVVPARVMCILESPSSDEDRTGVPLSGAEGDLLRKMLKAIDLDVGIQTYVAYLSPWRTPGARVLTDMETKEGLTLLAERVRLVQPQFILACGVSVVRAMMGMTLGQVRSKKALYNEIPFYATFAPAFLIKNPDYKKQAWADLKKFQTALKND